MIASISNVNERTAPYEAAPTVSGQFLFDNDIIQQMSSVQKLETKTADEILDTAFLARPSIIEGLLPLGTSILAGAPKMGKSFMVMQMAYHVSKGIPLWGHNVRQGSVLYLSLEDNERRIQRRLSRMFEVEGSANLYFATESECISNGLEDQIRMFISEHPDTRLIVIDTLQKVREQDGARYADDYSVISAIKRLTDNRDLAVLFVHHIRKLESEDPLDRISGTNGLAGAADGAYILSKDERTSNNGTIDVISRDLPDMRLMVEFNRETCTWNLLEEDKELWTKVPDPLLEAINTRLLGDCDSWEGSASTMLLALSEFEMTPNVLSRKLNVSIDRLMDEYSIRLDKDRSGRARSIMLTRIKKD